VRALNKITAYRMKHAPTGLYYCPSRTVRVTVYVSQDRTHLAWVKSNLSKRGKVYPVKPTFKWLGKSLYSHLRTFTPDDLKYRRDRNLVPFVEDDWVIEEVA
jgi:hypothetical protein